MSLERKRAEIADALNTAPGVRGYPTPPTAPKTGDAWPRWRGDERADGFMFMRTWAVFVVTPQDEVLAADWADEHGWAIAEALEDTGVLFVTGVEPVKVPVAGPDTFALMITGRSE